MKLRSAVWYAALVGILLLLVSYQLWFRPAPQPAGEAAATATRPAQVAAKATSTATETPTPAPTDTPAPTATPTPWLLSGIIRDRENDRALPQAKVRVAGQEAITEADGRYRFQGLAPDREVVIEATGYEPQTVTWKGENPLNILLQPERVVMWLFDDATLLPLANATVKQGSKELKANERGLVLLSHLQPGDTVEVLYPGYASQKWTSQGEKELRLWLKPHVARLLLRDALTADPVTGASLTLLQDGKAQPLSVTSTDGRYELKALTSNATLRISATGYISATTVLTAGLSLTKTLAIQPFIVKAVYIPFGLLSLPDHVRGILDMVDRTELNGIVVDIKSDRGRLAYQSKLDIAIKGEALMPGLMDIHELLRLCKDKKIYTIARLVAFKDPILVSVKPEWAIKRENGKTYVDLEGLSWGDPREKGVRNYLIDVAKEMAEFGFDEIQFDYIRFPSDGYIEDLQYFITSTVQTRSEGIARFAKEAHAALQPLGVAFSADVFGLAPWLEDHDMGIGQLYKPIAAEVDYISPMLYPATFPSTALGYQTPSAHPYDVIYRSCMAAKAQSKTRLRPWLQAYSWDVPYDVNEYRLQKKGAEDAKTHGWIFWNSGGVYKEAVFEKATPKP